MNEETILNGNTEETGGISILEILSIFRVRWLLILIITVIFGVGGFAYAKIRKPVYTASVPVQFTVEDTNQRNSANYLFAYFNTAVEFCKGGVVIDRANVYYAYYLDFVKTGRGGVDDFIAELYSKYATVKATHEEIPDYVVDDTKMNTYRDRWYDYGNVGASYKTKNTETIFTLWVKNVNSDYAREMARIYAFAADVALNLNVNFGDATTGVIELSDSAKGVSVVADLSTGKVVLIAVILGFILSLAAAYLLYLADNTVKSKEQLEKITGANVIAYIEDIAEAK